MLISSREVVSTIFAHLICPSFLGVAEMSLTKWEEENTPFQLPEDYKAFLQISDGLSLNWKIKRNE